MDIDNVMVASLERHGQRMSYLTEKIDADIISLLSNRPIYFRSDCDKKLHYSKLNHLRNVNLKWIIMAVYLRLPFRILFHKKGHSWRCSSSEYNGIIVNWVTLCMWQKLMLFVFFCVKWSTNAWWLHYSILFWAALSK